MTGPYELAMFPLGTVLFPTMVLPLHLFEPRYRALAHHLTGGDVEPEFGVVLIERGSEVGGEDVRTGLGTVARVVEAREAPDGRWALVSIGTRRIRVESWLADDPWPRALVVDVADDPDDADVDPGRWAAVEPKLRRSLALAAELGEARAPVGVELDADPAVATFQAAAIAPLGPLDQLAVLATGGATARVERLGELLEDQLVLLEARLGSGSD